MLREAAIEPHGKSPTRETMEIYGNTKKIAVMQNNFLKALSKEVEEHKDCDCFIFSDEGIAKCINNRRRMKEFKRILKQYFDEFTIIIYLRRQDGWLQSALSQSLRSGKCRASFYNHIYKLRRILKFDKILSLWFRHFGKENVIVRTFSQQEFYDGSLIKDYCHAINIKYNNEYKEDRVNLSLSTEGQIYLFCINFLNRAGKLSKAERLEMLAYINKTFVGKGFEPTAKQYQQIKKFYTPINAAFGKEALKFPENYTPQRPLDKATIKLIKNRKFQLKMLAKLQAMMQAPS